MLALFALLAGCFGGDPPECADTWQDTGVQVGLIEPDCRCDDGVLEIGTGELEYEPLADGADLEMVNGPQGGWHLLTAVHSLNTRDVVTVNAQVFHDETGEDVTSELIYRVQLVDQEEACAGDFPNMYLYILHETGDPTPPERWSCEILRIEMTLTDTGGRRVEAVKRVRAVPDPDNVASGLAEACD